MDGALRCSECKQIRIYGGKHVLLPSAEPRRRISTPQDVYRKVKRILVSAKVEKMVALYLDAQNALILRETVAMGSLNTSRIAPEEIIRPAILHHAKAIVIAHNHPSGSLDPSADDLRFTSDIRRACGLFTFELYDHLIVSKAGFVSLKERGCM